MFDTAFCVRKGRNKNTHTYTHTHTHTHILIHMRTFAHTKGNTGRTYKEEYKRVYLKGKGVGGDGDRSRHETS